jgi:hypothetical protein
MATIIQPKLPRVTFFARTPGERYRPSNGSEGEYFHAMWCEECSRDKAMNGTCHRESREPEDDDYCEILNRSFRDDPLPEWVIGDDGQPKCTAFAKQTDGPLKVVRDDKTQDMFDECCPTCGAEDGGTSCGMPNCGLLGGHP